MADYYPVLARAVAALPNSTPELRSTIYARARAALLGQLRAVQPPIAEEDIEREGQLLDEAIARLEAEALIPPSPEPPTPPEPAPEAESPKPPQETGNAPEPLVRRPDPAAGTLSRPNLPPRPVLPPRPTLPPRPGSPAPVAGGLRSGLGALEAARQRAGLDGTRPNTIAWLDRIHARPAYRQALERGGPYAYG